MNRRSCWAPNGTRPQVACQVIREYVYLYGAVSPKDGTCVYLIMPASDNECFQVFLETLAKKYPRPIPPNWTLRKISGTKFGKKSSRTTPSIHGEVYAKLEDAALYIERNPALVNSITLFPYITKSL
jgi:hypothetical protein